MVWKRVTKKTPGKGWWDEKKKIEVLQSYILLGNLRLAAATNNVPEITCRQWKASQWWKDNEEELRRGSKLQLSARLSDLVSKAMSTLADRIENGDFMYNRIRDEWVRKPISAETANKITAQLVDRVIAVEKHATPEKVNDEGLEARLMKLKKEMLGFARVRVIPPHSQTDKDVIDAPFEELQKVGHSPIIYGVNDNVEAIRLVEIPPASTPGSSAG